MDEVLISYSTKDKKWADAACSVLEAHGIRCWIAPRDIVPGTEWGEAIIAGIDACKVMVLIFSASANASPQVRREVERAISKGLPVVPCRIENVMPVGALEFALGNTHWLDVFTPPVERQMNRLAESVEALLQRDRGASTVVGCPIPASATGQNEGLRESSIPRWNWRGKLGLIAAVFILFLLLAVSLVVFWHRRNGDSVPENVTLPPEAVVAEQTASLAQSPAAATSTTPAERRSGEPQAIKSAPTVDHKQFSIVGGSWHIEGDELVQTDEGAVNAALTFGEAQWTDYDFTVDVMRTSGANQFSLYIRASDQNNKLLFVAGTAGQMAYSDTVHEGAVAKVQEQICEIIDNKWYTARVQVRGIHFVCSLNDGVNDIVRFVGGGDVSHLQGRVGLATSNSVYRFKNIKITDPAHKVLWKGPPDINP
jgi:hypothetical protein